MTKPTLSVNQGKINVVEVICYFAPLNNTTHSQYIFRSLGSNGIATLSFQESAPFEIEIVAVVSVLHVSATLLTAMTEAAYLLNVTPAA